LETRHVSVTDGDLLLMVGTMKGAFLVRSSPDRKRWDWGGPYFPGHAVYAMAFDGHDGSRRVFAAPESMHFGSLIRWTDDFGKTWTNPEAANVRFPEGSGSSLKRIWQIEVGGIERLWTLYCGVEPAALFESNDGGENWSLVRGLYEHPHREKWQPGGGGLCLHTVLTDGLANGRMLVAISTGGVYVSDDAGQSWRASNQGVRAEFLPDKHPEFGQCVHKVARAAGSDSRLYLQNHWGLYRSDDAGQSWSDIANGVPSDFGFPMVAHPHDADTAFIVPLESDGFRVTPEAKLRVYRTRDGGNSWQPMTRGLPQKEALETVLRDGMTSDRLDPAGVYFGTRSGKLFASTDEGDSWRLLRDGLPPIVCLKVAMVGEPKAPRARQAPERTKARKRRPAARAIKRKGRVARKAGRRK